MCLFTSLIIITIIVSVLLLCLLAIALWPFVFTILCNINVPFSIAKLSCHFTFVPFLPVSAYWTFCLYILVQCNVLFLWNDFSLSHDVLFLQNCALSFVFVHFSNSYRLLTFLLCVLMQYKCPFHETYCPLSQVCPFSSQLRWFISLSLPSSNFLVFLALFLVSINSILPFSLCLFRMCACFF